MPSVSYLRNNDYTPQQFRPYELPYNAMLQNIATKTAYWQQGVQQIQQQHKNALGLDPLFAQNKAYLKNYMEEANKKLAQVAKSDLSIQDNAAQAKTIFAPLYDTSNEFNANLLEDAGLNKFYQEQAKITNASRTTDNGKGYSQTNEAYWRNHYNEYATAAQRGEDPAKIKEFSQRRKGYVPYYDISGDIKEAIKNCHPSSTETQDQLQGNSLYLHNIKTKGVTEENMQGCLSFMPEKAKQQIQIENSVKYYNNKEGLAADYKYLVKDRYTESAQALKAKISAMKLDKKADPAAIAAAEAMLAQKEEQVQAVNSEWESMIAQNGPDFVNKNYDSIAGQVGWNHFTNNAGKVYSWKEISNKLSPNAAGMMERRLEADAEKFRVGEQNDFVKLGLIQNHDIRMEEIKHQNKLLEDAAKEGRVNKDGMIVPSATPAILQADAVGELPEGMGKTTFEGELINKETALTESENTLKRIIAQQLGKDVSQLTESEITNFTHTAESGEVSDPLVKVALQSVSKARVDLQNAKEKAKSVSQMNVVERDKLFGSQRIQYPGVNNNSGINMSFSERELAGMRDGNVVQASDGTKFRITKGSTGSNLGLRSGASEGIAAGISLGGLMAGAMNLYKSSNGYNMEKQLPNGQWVAIDNKGILTAVDQIDNQFKKYEKIADKNYNQSLIGIAPVFRPNFSKKERTEVEENAASILGLAGNPNFHVDVQFQDKDGAAIVKVWEKVGDAWSEKGSDYYEQFMKNNAGVDKGISGWAYMDKDGKNLTHLKVNGVLGKLPYQEAEESQPIAEFTNNRLSNMKNGEASKDYYIHVTSTGTNIRVGLTKIQNAPMYTIERFWDGAYKKINLSIPLTSPQAVTETLKNIDKL